MPILVEITYADENGNVLNGQGPKELYIPKVNSSKDLNTNVLFDALEEELEEYEPFESSPVVIRWKVITCTVQ